MVAFWLTWAVIFYGFWQFQYFVANLTFLPEALNEKLAHLPLLGDVTINSLIAVVVFPGAIAYFLHRFLNQPRQADFLIETEQELRKVNWPTRDETVQASIVVMVVVLVLAVFLAGSDFLLGQVFERILH
jgi:preprotein translocase subunit SecE